jgi:hypothetical protein
MSRKKIIIICRIAGNGRRWAIYAYREYHRTNVNLASVTPIILMQATDAGQ